MHPLFTSEQAAAIDLNLIQNHSVSGYELMCRAAQACADQVFLRWGHPASILIFVGVGNNGGDGYEVGRLLAEVGCAVKIIEVSGGAKTEDALATRQSCLRAADQFSIEMATPDSLDALRADLIIDAIFGIGLKRSLSKELVALLKKINDSGIPVLAVDIPSGLNADTGCAMPCAIRSDVTVTFIAHKRGLYTSAAKDFCGEVVYADLGVGFDSKMQIVSDIWEPDAWLYDSDDLQLMPPRRHASHKGDYGHLLLVGGDFGMGGAMRLAGESAMACGTGLVSIATRPDYAAALTSACPVLMVHGITKAADLNPLLEAANTVVVGPGLGAGEWGQALFEQVMQSPHPKVIDAGALTLLAKQSAAGGNPYQLDQCVLTPHPGEAARLLQSSGEEIQADRFAACREIASRFGSVCALKGSGTIICSEAQTWVCAGGNPAMATAGMGDVLSGIIGALIAQSQALGQTLGEAAKNAVGLHARVADEAVASGQSVLLASDMFERLRWAIYQSNK